MKLAVLSAGAGGASAAVEMTLQGHEVRLWNRAPATLEPFRRAGGVQYTGVFGAGFVPLAAITDDLRAAVCDADLILVCLPTLAHAGVAAMLIEAGCAATPVLLNPGHTGGALEVGAVFDRAGIAVPPIAEFSTLTYVARKSTPHTVSTTGRAKKVALAALPGGGPARELAARLYDCAWPVPDVLATGLRNVNMVLHTPGALLGAAWIEATGGDFTFYVEGLSDGVARVMERLDDERRAVGRAFGHELASLFDEMSAIGTIEPGADRAAGLAAAIRGGTANQAIKAPGSLSHRYFLEDFWYGLKPFLALADIAGVRAETASALMVLCTALLGPLAPGEGRSAAAMGVAGLTRDQLVAMIREG